MFRWSIVNEVSPGDAEATAGISLGAMSAGHQEGHPTALARTADLFAATRGDDELIGQQATPALISTLTTERTPMRAVVVSGPGQAGVENVDDPAR